MKQPATEEISIKKINGEGIRETTDFVAVEEPLEIQVAYSTANGQLRKTISVTMRTPGNDEALAAGFLFTEGIISTRSAIRDVKHLSSDDNRMLVTLSENILPVLNNAERNFYSTSSCGICGKASIEAIRNSVVFENEKDNISISGELLCSLPEKLRNRQQAFKATGGMHASALFTFEGEFIMLHEDVGRHNALDKLIGAAFLNNSLPLNNCILLLSGRSSFELIQKAAMAGIKIIVAVGAPSSLAVEMAHEAGITLAGFLRGPGFNVYAGVQRIRL